jgi:SNF2 family DNA or RNA helicase
MGLRAGNTALNLTAANRVILIDLWWNKTAESQAFGRVKRIGQTKETYFVRILCKTVDNVIDEMQISKSTKISYALQDDGHTPVEVDEDRMTKLFMDPAPAKKPKKKKKKNAMINS